jgi:hypothetical protein
MEGVVYLQGKESFQQFEGIERLTKGIEKRIRHSTAEDIQIHDAFLDPAIQEGHVHTAGYEAIMLLQGDIEALVWNKNKIKLFPLKGWGDLIIFLPGSFHTLIVKEKSRIIVVKNFIASPERDQRQKVNLPTSIESLREAVLEGKKTITEVLKEVKTKL